MSKKKLNTKFTYKTVLDAASFTFICVALNNCFSISGFLSLPFFIALCYNKKNPVFFAVLFCLSFAISKNFQSLMPAALSAAFIAVIFAIYNKKGRTPNAELIIYSLISAAAFVFLTRPSDYLKTMVYAAVCVALTFIFISSSAVAYVKKLSSKISGGEYLCLAITAFFIELGVIRIFSPLILKSIIIFAILFLGYVYKNPSAGVIAAVVLSIAPSVFSSSFTPIAAYVLLAAAYAVFVKNSRIISAFSLLCVDVVLLTVFKAFGNFYYVDVFYSVTPVAAFLFFPKEILEKIKSTVYSFDEKHLSKYAVNKARLALSNKLYGVSDVFFEMKNSFDKLKDSVIQNDELLTRMCDEIICNVCKNCLSYNRCRLKNLPDRAELIKILSVGVSKNRISLIDLTKNFTENCGYANSVIFEMNALITKYKEKIKELEDLSTGKELIKLQAEGVAEVLKGMAFDMSKTLTYNSAVEKKLFDFLKKQGVAINEIMAICNDKEPELDFILPKKSLENDRFISAVSSFLGRKMNVVSKIGLSENKCAVTVKPTPATDAAFGLATAVKDGSLKSGDTHSLVKLSQGKFLIALSDGMGSGIKAENTSSTAISLIESFYKAGLDGNLILSIVNKVLALNTDDNFSAMDILTVDLFSLKADFIKIGAPQSYVLSDTCVKLIEGSSLPLGILDELKPTGYTANLEWGNTVIMTTDGVSDSFGSSTDFIEFLKTLPCKNPQAVADDILNRAVQLNGGVKKDDMTVLAVRIFLKTSRKDIA